MAMQPRERCPSRSGKGHMPVSKAGGVRVMVLCFRMEAHGMGKNKDRGSRQSSRQ